MQAIIVLNGTAEEIAALALAVQERRDTVLSETAISPEKEIAIKLDRTDSAAIKACKNKAYKSCSECPAEYKSRCSKWMTDTDDNMCMAIFLTEAHNKPLLPPEIQSDDTVKLR